MRINFQATALAVSINAALLPLAAQAGVGTDTAATMTKYYNDTRAYCNSPSSPAFMCSGILLRATVPSTAYHSWNPSPLSVSNGGVSFSYLRKDATFSKLAYGHNNGFTLTPYNHAPEGTIEPEVLCAFPADAATNNRFSQGCGDSQSTAEKEDLCQTLGITTAELWRNAFFAAGKNHSRQCAFDTREGLSINGAKSFYEMIRAMAYLQAPPSYVQNELRMATWEQNKPLPIQSFFYTTDGLADAQTDQKDWFKTNGAYVPIISISLPDAANPAATFTYKADDQAVCEQYIETGTWKKRHDPGINRQAWTLAVTPTQCGRRIDESQHNAAYAELVNKFSGAPEWNEENGGGMRHQMVCHVDIARNKPTWNLEPFRPDVSRQESVDAGCNPVNKINLPPDLTDLSKRGPAVVAELTARYNNKAVNCGTAAAPAYMCSGVLATTTYSVPPVHAWDVMDTTAYRRGQITAAFLRADAKMKHGPVTTHAGFILKPTQKIMSDELIPDILCFSPSQSGPNNRDQQGCGGLVHYNAQAYYLARPCQEQGINTAEQWQNSLYATVTNVYGVQDVSGYNNALIRTGYACAFDVRPSLKEGATTAFNEVIKLRNQLPLHENPNVLSIGIWPLDSGEKLPIEAFYYSVPESKAKAQNDQRDFFKETGRSIPLIMIRFPATPADEAVFEFIPGDQAI